MSPAPSELRLVMGHQGPQIRFLHCSYLPLSVACCWTWVICPFSSLSMLLDCSQQPLAEVWDGLMGWIQYGLNTACSDEPGWWPGLITSLFWCPTASQELEWSWQSCSTSLQIRNSGRERDWFVQQHSESGSDKNETCLTASGLMLILGGRLPWDVLSILWSFPLKKKSFLPDE